MSDDEFLDVAQAELEFLTNQTLVEYQALPIPRPVDARLVALCDVFREATQVQRETLVLSLGKSAGYVLLVFIERMAMLAVRQGSIKPLCAGLLAWLMIDRNIDPQDLLMVLSLLYRSAVKLGAEPRHLFAGAVKFSTSEFISHLLLSFLDRSPEDRSVEAMGYREFQGPNGIVYWFGRARVPSGLLGGDVSASPSG